MHHASASGLAEAKTALRHLRAKLEMAIRRVIGYLSVVILEWEVALKDLHGLLVDVLIGVLLQGLQPLQPVRLLHLGCEGVLAKALLLLPLPAHLEDVLDGLERHGSNLAVRDAEQVDQGPDAALLDEVLDLVRLAPGGRVADRPRGLLLDVEVGRREQLDDRRNQPAADDLLNLLPVAGRDVGDRPASLLSNRLLRVGEQLLKRRQCTALQDDLCLVIVTRDDVADGPQRWRLYKGERVQQQFHEPAADPSLDDSSYPLVGAV
mmetsp:Transcript_35273/g.112203  ORF Transcript_35273/g.112203 Transcript_35273/m.112203 type:complete len:264 (-) Transcript_35273:995-1786(-)